MHHHQGHPVVAAGTMVALAVMTFPVDLAVLAGCTRYLYLGLCFVSIYMNAVFWVAYLKRQWLGGHDAGTVNRRSTFCSHYGSFAHYTISCLQVREETM